MQILHVQRLIESEIVFEARDICGRDVRILQIRRKRTARSFVQDEKENHRDQEHQWNRLQRAPHHVVEDGLRPPLQSKPSADRVARCYNEFAFIPARPRIARASSGVATGRPASRAMRATRSTNSSLRAKRPLL